MNFVRVKAYAKINLTLDVLEKSGGYHMIDSVVATIDLYDLIVARRRKDNLINITMRGYGSEGIPQDDNNAYKAAIRFVEKFKTCGADITVYKNIPMGAGLGGSSADVAGTLNALSRLYEVDDFAALKEIADGIGSDCGYMLTGGYARLTGRGERVLPIQSKLKLYVGILVPDGGVSTAECYAACDGYASDRKSAAAQEALIEENAEALARSLSNVLYRAAAQINADVVRAYEELAAFAPLGVNMSGSGSAVYAVFENDQFLSYARSRYKGAYKFISTKTVIK